MRFHPARRRFADIQPMTDEFGWPRRNAFIQPQVDAVMLEAIVAFSECALPVFPRAGGLQPKQDDEVTLAPENGRRAAGNGQSPVAGGSGWWGKFCPSHPECAV